MSINISAVLLSAGECSRFWPLAEDKHKSMYDIMGKPVIYYTIKGLKHIGVRDFVVVTSPSDKSIENYFGDGSNMDVNIRYVIQEKPLGMGDAVLTGAKNISGDHFFVLNADQSNADELGTKMIDMLHQDKSIDSVLASQKTDTPHNYGILEIDGDKAKGIEEKPAPGTEKSDKMVIGIYLLAKRFLDTLEKVPISQYSYETALEEYIKKYDTVGACVFEDIPEITLKFPWHLFRMNKYLMDKYLTKQHISTETTISPKALISGNVVIEKGVRIFENAVIKGPCYISEGAIIGNNSLVRDYSYIGRNSIVGFGTEVKHSILYNNIETHNNYLGDSIIDDNSGFGAGTITANRRLDRNIIKSNVKGDKVETGYSFFGTVIGKNVHTGIMTGIMPGIKIGSYSNVGAMTNLTKDIVNNTYIYSQQEYNISKDKPNHTQNS